MAKIGSAGWTRLAAIGLAVGLFAAVVAAAHAQQAPGERRVALVVGNGAYQSEGRLANAPNDAQAMGAALARLGFDVETLTDQTRSGFEQALRRFSRRAAGADVALFFYAGHGVQVSDVNYLLPVDARPERPEDMRFDAIDLSQVVAVMQDARLRILLLDACRNNPLAASLASRGRGVSRGLARVETADAGTLIAFATAPGTTADDGDGRNSPFTAALLQHLPSPGLELRQVLTRVRNSVMQATGDRQVPWENSSLRTEVYLGGAAPSAGTVPVPQTAVGGRTSAPAVGPQVASVAPAAAVHECDRLAAPVAAPERLVRGVPFTQVDGPAARRACEAARLADPDEPRFMAYLGRAMERLSDLPEALRLYRLAAERGYPYARCSLGRMYADGTGVMRSDAEAVRNYRAAAERGAACGQINLALMVQQGQGVARNPADAFRLLRMAADQGDAEGQTYLANAYALGLGTPRNQAEALRLYRLAIDQGHPLAQNNLGVMYRDGLGGVARNDREAARLFALAAEQGEDNAQANLCFMYINGRGVPRDRQQAIDWCRRAAQQGNQTAINNLRSLGVRP